MAKELFVLNTRISPNSKLFIFTNSTLTPRNPLLLWSFRKHEMSLSFSHAGSVVLTWNTSIRGYQRTHFGKIHTQTDKWYIWICSLFNKVISEYVHCSIKFPFWKHSLTCDVAVASPFCWVKYFWSWLSPNLIAGSPVTLASNQIYKYKLFIREPLQPLEF